MALAAGIFRIVIDQPLSTGDARHAIHDPVASAQR
jgi:hypothetical protein